MVPRRVVALAASLMACDGASPPARDAGGRAPAIEAIPQIAATCAELIGTADARRKGETSWNPIAVGATLRERDWVRTGAGAFARLRYVAGAFLSMYANSTLLIDRTITVGDGTVDVAVDVGQSLSVRTADGTIARFAANGRDGKAELRLTATKDRGLELAVTVGEVRLVTDQGEQAISAGQSSDVASGGASAPLALLASPSDLASEAEIALAPDAALALGWGQVAPAARYRLQIARDPSFRVLVDERTVDEAGARFTPAEPGEFSWRVASIDPAGHLGLFSPPRAFRVLEAPRPDLLLAPAEGARIGFADKTPRVTFAWRTAGPARTYRLVVVQGTNLTAKPVATATTRALRAELGTLREGTYHWGVFASDGTREEPMFPRPRTLTIRKQRVKVHTEKLWSKPR